MTFCKDEVLAVGVNKEASSCGLLEPKLNMLEISSQTHWKIQRQQMVFVPRGKDDPDGVRYIASTIVHESLHYLDINDKEFSQSLSNLTNNIMQNAPGNNENEKAKFAIHVLGASFCRPPFMDPKYANNAESKVDDDPKQKLKTLISEFVPHIVGARFLANDGGHFQDLISTQAKLSKKTKQNTPQENGMIAHFSELLMNYVDQYSERLGQHGVQILGKDDIKVVKTRMKKIEETALSLVQQSSTNKVDLPQLIPQQLSAASTLKSQYDAILKEEGKIAHTLLNQLMQSIPSHPMIQSSSSVKQFQEWISELQPSDYTCDKAIKLIDRTKAGILEEEIKTNTFDGVYNKLLEHADKYKEQKAQLQTQWDQLLSIQKLQSKQDQQDVSQKQNNLRRYGKWDGESEMMEELVKANMGKEGVLEEMREKASGEVKMDGRQDGAKKNGKVELVGEVHDQHGTSVRKLVERMERGEIGAGTVVALERKEGGEHLGMRDVRLLVEVLRHNEGCKEDERVALPAGIEGTALWRDAKLVNTAQKHGGQVVGVEGKGLAHAHGTPEYNKDREDYMAQQLHHLKQQEYDVIMPVGEAHVEELQARLSANAVVEIMQKIMQQNNVQIGQDKGQRISQYPATIDVKQTYGKFTAQSARGSSNNRGIM